MSSQYEDNEFIDEYEDDVVSPNQPIQWQVNEADRMSAPQENKVIHAEQVNGSNQQQVQQAIHKPALANDKQPLVWKINDMTSNGSPRGFNIYNALMQNNPYQYTFYGEEVTNRWKENFQYVLGPTNPAFVDATLSYKDIAWGYRLEYNPNGILWRVSAAGIPHPDDYDNFIEQNRVIESTTNRTIDEFQSDKNDDFTNNTGSSNQNTLTWAINKGLILDSSGKIVVSTVNEDSNVSNLVYYDNGSVNQQAQFVGWWDDVKEYINEKFDSAKRYAYEQFEFLKAEGESLADTALGILVIDKMKNTFSIFKQTAPSLGPAGTIEVAVDTTPGSVIALKGVSKVFGGVISLGQTTYDVYVDYRTFGATANFAKVASVDIGTTVVVAVGSAGAVSLGAPVIAVAVVGGGIIYYINRKYINPWKNSLETE